MKNLKSILIALFTLVTASCIAQTQWCSFDKSRGWTSGTGNLDAEEVTRTDDTGLKDIVARIKSALGYNAYLRLMLVKNKNNAMALYQNGQRYLIIDVDFLEDVNYDCDNDWAAISIIAHEIGHHYAGFRDSPHQKELKADYWSGYILYKLGASEESACAAMALIGEEFDSHSHPNRQKRINSIRSGYRDAKAGR